MTRNEKRRSLGEEAPASPARRSSREQPYGTGAERKTQSIVERRSSVKSLNYMGLDTSTEWDFLGMGWLFRPAFRSAAAVPVAKENRNPRFPTDRIATTWVPMKRDSGSDISAAFVDP